MAAMEKDTVTARQLDIKLFWRLFQFGLPHLHLIVIAFGLIMVGTATTLALPWIIQRAIDGPIAAKDLGALHTMVLFYLGVMVVDFLALYLQAFCTGMLGQRVMYDLRNRIFEKMQDLSIPWFDRNPVGRIVTRITSDVENLNQLFTQGIVLIFKDIFLIVGILVVMVAYNTTLSLWTFTVLPFLVVATFIFRNRVRNGFDAIRVHLARINSSLQENITGMKTVQLFLREAKNARIFGRINRDHTTATNERSSISLSSSRSSTSSRPARSPWSFSRAARRSARARSPSAWSSPSCVIWKCSSGPWPTWRRSTTFSSQRSRRRSGSSSFSTGSPMWAIVTGPSPSMSRSRTWLSRM